MALKLGMQHWALPRSFISWPWVDLLYGKVKNVLSGAFIWENTRTKDIMINSEDFGLNMYTVILSTKRLVSTRGQDYSLTFDPRFWYFCNFKQFLKIHLASCNQISCRASMGWGKENLFKRSRSHDQYGCHTHIQQKPLKIFSITNWPMVLKHWDCFEEKTPFI